MEQWYFTLRHKETNRFFGHRIWTENEVITDSDLLEVLSFFADYEGTKEIPVQVISWQRINN